MRVRGLCCGVVVALGLAAVAQSAEMRVGLIGGFNSNRTSAFPPQLVPGASIGASGDTQNVTSLSVHRLSAYMAGGILEWDFGDVGALRLEPKYTQKGTGFKAGLRLTSSTEVQIDQDLELDYVEVPVLWRSAFFKSKPVQVYMMSGLTAGYLVTAEIGGSDVKDDFESFELGLLACIGFQGRVGNGMLFVDGRVSASLTRIDVPFKPDAAKMKNTAYSASIGYAFSLGAK